MVRYPEAVSILEGTWNTISSGYPSGPIVWGEKGALIVENGGDHAFMPTFVFTSIVIPQRPARCIAPMTTRCLREDPTWLRRSSITWRPENRYTTPWISITIFGLPLCWMREFAPAGR